MGLTGEVKNGAEVLPTLSLRAVLLNCSGRTSAALECELSVKAGLTLLV
jgi:hypothetical protein